MPAPAVTTAPIPGAVNPYLAPNAQGPTYAHPAQAGMAHGGPVPPPPAHLVAQAHAAGFGPDAPEAMLAAQAAAASGTPYRVLPGAAEATFVLPPARKPRPILGASITLFAAMLWAFVVAGQLTTSWSSGAPIGQGTAAVFVLVATALGWIGGLRQGYAVTPSVTTGRLVGRAIGVGMLGFVLFVLTIFGAAIAGNVASKNHDFLVAFLLVMVALVAAIAGPKITSPVPIERTHRMRVALIAMWVAGTLVTLIAGIDLAANG